MRTAWSPLRAHLLQQRQRLSRPFTTSFRSLQHPQPPADAPAISESTLNSTPDPSTPPSQPPPSPFHQPWPSSAPKRNIDIKHIRQNVALHEANCRHRNYTPQAAYPSRIASLHAQWVQHQHDARSVRQRSNAVRRRLANPATTQHDDDLPTDPTAAAAASPDQTGELLHIPRDRLLAEARDLKSQLAAIEEAEAALHSEIESLALAIPNLTLATGDSATPIGNEPRLLSYINDHPEPPGASSDRVWRSHVHVGTELDLLDFAAAAGCSGWGWYYLLGLGAQLEQALIQYALTVASRAGWTPVAPPSMVYAHIAAACGFQPRDQNGETQIYSVAQDADDAARGRPGRVLAATAEIPLAAMKADITLNAESLPLRRAAQSRCYRAEAGARGLDTKGLYRVHEFSKVELFAWTAPDATSATEALDEMLDLQTEILGSLGLHCRVLEMPTGDLGASAARKVDVEAFFPSRREKNGGWGEVASASICTDYQSRRLATRVKVGGSMGYPWTVNGTALAVPRVLAAILENVWDEGAMEVRVPEVLWPWMDGIERITARRRRS